MAARTGGNVVSNIMDHLESTLVTDIGGLGSGAAITQFSIGGWYRSVSMDNVNKALCAFRNAEETIYGPYLHLRNYGIIGAGELTPCMTRNDGAGAAAATHYTRPTEFEDDEETDKYPIHNDEGVWWWLAYVIDASAGLDAPDVIDIWSYSPPVALGGQNIALRRVPMGHALDEENDFVRNAAKMNLGGWSGTVTDPLNHIKAHQCDFQDWWFIPAILTAQQAALMASGRAASSVLANVAGRKAWSLAGQGPVYKETFGSGDDLTSVGTVSYATNFAGVDVVPTAVALAGTPLNDSTDATSYTLTNVTTEANKPILIAIAVARTTTQAVQGVTGGGLTWNQIAIKQYGTANTIFLYAAYPTSAATFNVTIDCNDGGGNHLACIAIPFIISGSINSASFKVQSVTDSGTGTTAEPFTTPLSAFATGSGTLMIIGTGAAGVNIVPTSPMTEVSESSTATPVRFLAVHYDPAGDTTPQATLGSGTWGVIAVEVALAPAAAGGVSRQRGRGRGRGLSLAA